MYTSYQQQQRNRRVEVVQHPNTLQQYITLPSTVRKFGIRLSTSRQVVNVGRPLESQANWESRYPSLQMCHTTHRHVSLVLQTRDGRHNLRPRCRQAARYGAKIILAILPPVHKKAVGAPSTRAKERLLPGGGR